MGQQAARCKNLLPNQTPSFPESVLRALLQSSPLPPMEQTHESLHPPPQLEDCLRLLRGKRDEQILAGLLLVTKICNKDDLDSILRVYEAVGVRFLDRLLRTGMGNANATGGGNENQDVYLQLSVTILSVFCRVPQIAAAEEMVSKIPLILQIMTRHSALEECYEFLFLVAASNNKDGVTALVESGGLKVLATQMPSLPDGSTIFELSMRLLQLVVDNTSPDTLMEVYLSELSTMVCYIAQQFACLQNALKFELLHLLSIVLAWHQLGPLYDALQSVSNDKWPMYIQAAADQKLQALVVAESMVSMLGECWLIGQVNLHDTQSSFPSDRFLFLVLELSRVEVAVLLNDLGYLKYGASSSSSGDISQKQAKLSLAFNLLEKIIKLVSDVGEYEGGVISDDSITKVIAGLNETTGVVLEYLNDAKDHGQRKGDDLLASVRFVGSYLAEAPLACKEKVENLLGFLLSVEGEHEQSPFLSICFLLPMLYQITRTSEGCQVFVSSGGYKAVVGCVIELFSSSHHTEEESGSRSLACDMLINLLLMREQIRVRDEHAFVPLLRAFALWEEKAKDGPPVLMTSSICCLIFKYTSEESLLQYPGFDFSTLNALSQLIARSLSTIALDDDDATESCHDLHHIIIEGFSVWADRFPHISKAIDGLI
ncbi:Neurochondrin-like protein [Drosera capensis]